MHVQGDGESTVDPGKINPAFQRRWAADGFEEWLRAADVGQLINVFREGIHVVCENLSSGFVRHAARTLFQREPPL